MIINKIEVSCNEKGHYRLVERRANGSIMYMVHANSEEEARHLFDRGSHLVKFIGSLSW